MSIQLRGYRNEDREFLSKMLYEAIFWDKQRKPPSYEASLDLPYVKVVLEDWGSREGDVAVIAEADSKQVGAAWYRYWTKESDMRGYVCDSKPVLVIGIEQEYRGRGLGKSLIEWLINYATDQSVEGISLSVSKVNHAKKLYEKNGFQLYEDIDDSILMTIELQGENL